MKRLRSRAKDMSLNSNDEVVFTLMNLCIIHDVLVYHYLKVSTINQTNRKRKGVTIDDKIPDSTAAAEPMDTAPMRKRCRFKSENE